MDVNGLLLAVVFTDASIQDRDAAHRLLAALRVAFSTIRLVWADGGYPGRPLVWAEHVLALRIQIIKRIRGSTGFHVRPRVWVVERDLRVDQQAPPLRPRLRNQTRPPRSDGPHRHDRPHDPPTRPNMTGSQTRSETASIKPIAVPVFSGGIEVPPGILRLLPQQRTVSGH